MARILAFGSSSAYGLYDHAHGGWVDRLHTSMIQAVVERDVPLVGVHKLAMPGRTIDQTIERFMIDTAPYTNPAMPGRNIAALAVGSFDSARRQGEVEPITSPELFTQRLRHLGSLCLDNDMTVVLLGLTPVNDNVKPTNRSKEIYDQGVRAFYDRIISDYAKEIEAPFIDTLNVLSKVHKRLSGGVISFDGIHLNNRGHDIIHRMALPIFEPLVAPRS